MRYFVCFFLWCSILCATPKAIIFDFGGVVANSNRGPLLSFLSESLQIDAKMEFSGDKLYEALERGREFWQEYAVTHEKNLSPEWFASLEEKIEQVVEVLPEMQSLLVELKNLGYRVGLLSNTRSVRSRFFRRSGYYTHFDPILLSCEIGLVKPDPKIYQHLLQLLELPAEECLFIDNKKKNVTAARSLGFKAIHFKTFEQFKLDLLKNLSRGGKVVAK